MLPTLLLACGPSALDRPAAEPPVRPAPVASGAVSLVHAGAALGLPPTVRPGGAPAPEEIPLVGAFTYDDDRKKASVWAVPLPVAADLLPTATRGTHSFGSVAPPGFEVTGPDGALDFEQRGRKPGSWGFDRESLFVGVPLGGAAPDAAAHTVRFPKATLAEASMNLDTSGLTPEAFVDRTFTVGGESHAGWFLPAPATATLTLRVPERGVLAFSPGLLPPAIRGDAASDGADVVVRLTEAGATEELSRTRVTAPSFEPVRIDLQRWAGREVSLTIATEPGEDGALDYVLLEDPVVYPATDHPRKVVLVFVDTLRADHLGFMGYPRATSPHLDRWAAHAAVFERARTVAPWTLPSARAALTGSEPEDWFAREPVAARFGAAGFRTDAFVTNAFLSQPFGLERGWSRFRYEHLAPPDDVVADAIDRLRAWPDRDQLVLVHFMGPHLPWEEPWTYRWWWAGAQPGALAAPTRGQLSTFHRASPDFAEVEAWATDRYDQNVRWVDDELAALLEEVGPDATVALFSDHGEELWDHDGFEHGHQFGDELLRVPFVVKSPGVRPGRYDAPTSLLDLAPTLLELAGLPADDDAAGSSLVPYTFGDAGAAEALVARPLAFGRPLYGEDGWGVVAGERKWTARDGRQTVYDLRADPQERQDLAGSTELPPYHAALSAALGRPVHLVWRVSLEGDPWPFALTLTASHPEGIARVWPAYDPRGRLADTDAAVVEGRASTTVPADGELPSALYVLPVGDATRPGGLAVTLVGRQVQVAGAVPLGTEVAAGAVGTPFLTAKDARYHLSVGLAVVPAPSGTEVAGFHPDLESQLRDLGYLGE